jgi:DNA-binding IscR family transcriptional regulator
MLRVVIQVIDGPFVLTACSPADHGCEQFTACAVCDLLWRIKDRILSILQRLTLAEIAAGGTFPIMVKRGERGVEFPVESR